MGLEADTIRSLGRSGPRSNLFGRRMIKLPYDRIDSGNVLEAVGKALAVHMVNAGEIRYLWDYYRGKQPILGRVKPIRPEINNRIVVNVANEIVSFKVGYHVGEPVQYVGRNSNDGVAEAVVKLNDYMFAEDKASQDQEIVEWNTICGTAYRIVLPDQGEEDDSPFEMYTLDPADTFVAYSTKLGNEPLFGCTFYRTKDGYEMVVYTKDEVYTITGRPDSIATGKGVIARREGHMLGMVPIFEYPANRARLGGLSIGAAARSKASPVPLGRMAPQSCRRCRLAITAFQANLKSQISNLRILFV